MSPAPKPWLVYKIGGLAESDATSATCASLVGCDAGELEKMCDESQVSLSSEHIGRVAEDEEMVWEVQLRLIALQMLQLATWQDTSLLSGTSYYCALVVLPGVWGRCWEGLEVKGSASDAALGEEDGPAGRARFDSMLEWHGDLVAAAPTSQPQPSQQSLPRRSPETTHGRCWLQLLIQRFLHPAARHLTGPETIVDRECSCCGDSDPNIGHMFPFTWSLEF